MLVEKENLFFVFNVKLSSNNNNNNTNNTTVPAEDLSTINSNSFTKNAFLDLETKVYGDNWSIPYKRKF